MDSAVSSNISVHDKVLGATEIWALAGILDEHGYDTDQLLRGVELDRQMLCHPQTRIALSQQLSLHAAVPFQPLAAPLAVAAGMGLHLTAFGTVGFAMLSSPNLEFALSAAVRYAHLLNMKFDLQILVEAGQAIIRFQDRYVLDLNAREQCLQLDMAKITTLLRDLAGHRFVLTGLSVNLVAPRWREWNHPHFGCAVLEGENNELRFEADLLGLALPQAHSLNCSGALEICDKLINIHANQQSLPFQIKRMLLTSTGAIASLADVADQMCMSPRTLRRRLEASNTSYVRILEDVRKTLAMRILSSTAMTTEAIAERLGYSDAANFRHAFKRWTGCSPRQFRQSYGAASHEPVQSKTMLTRDEHSRITQSEQGLKSYGYA